MGQGLVLTKEVLLVLTGLCKLQRERERERKRERERERER